MLDPPVVTASSSAFSALSTLISSAELRRIVHAQVKAMLRDRRIDGQDAEDLTQQIMLFLLQNQTRVLSGHDPRRGRFRNYVRAIARHQVLCAITKADRRNRLCPGLAIGDEVPDMTAMGPLAEQTVVARDLCDRLLSRLEAKLQSDDIVITRMRFFQERSARDIAKQVRTSEQAVYERIRRIRGLAQAFLRENSVG